MKFIYLRQTLSNNFYSKLMNFRFYILLLSVFSFFYSCNNEDINEITEIRLEAPIIQNLLNQDFSFTVKGNNSEDITNEATIKINGQAIENAVFNSSEIGFFQVQAHFNGLESNIIEIEVVAPSAYVQNVLIEDYTGTWCVNCPRLSYAIEHSKEVSDKVVSVGVHTFDSMVMDGYQILTDEFNIINYPTGIVNRDIIWPFPEDNFLNTATDLTGFDADLGLSINSSITNSVVNMNIEIGFNADFSTPLNLVVYLVENGLIYDQLNNTDYYGGGSIIYDFVHNDVLRAIFTGHLGDPLPANETHINNIYSVDVQGSIPETVEDQEQLHIVAFVTDATTKKVLNVREVKVGEAQELQILE